MSELKLASWNIRDGLSDPSLMEDVIDGIISIDADVVTLPEAFHEEARLQPDSEKADTMAQAAWRLAGEGYHISRVLYGDIDGRRDRHGFALLTRLDETKNSVGVVSLGSRRVINQYVGEIGLDITGIHLDDRRETTRQAQARMLLGVLASSGPSVILGDFNSMHRSDKWARRLRAVKPVTPRIQRPLEIETAKDKILWKASLASRLTAMADGGTVDMFEQAGYHDIDPQHQATKGPAQLDRIMANFDDGDLSIGRYKVEDISPNPSDHKAISAVVSY